MNVPEVLAAIAVIVTVVTAATAIALFVRGSYAKARIEALRDDLDDERKSSESLRSRVTDLEKENERVKGRMDGLERENEILKKQPSLDLSRVILAISEVKREWLDKLDMLSRVMNSRFDRLEK